jgi:CHAD domain-containing protein
MLRRLPAALARLAAEVSAPRRRRLEDFMLDTRDMRLAEAGASLRLRIEEGKAAELTLKSLAPFSGGLARRAELSETLRRAPSPASGRCPGKQIAARVRPVLVGHPLRVRFQLTQQRDVYTIRTPRGAALLVSVDVISLTARTGRPVRRIEIERQSGPVKELMRFSNQLRRDLRLTPAKESKYDLGLRCAGLAHPTPAKRPSRSCGATTAARLAHSIRLQGAAIRRHVTGVLLDLDPEAIHDMRVACRRLRATLEAIAPAVGGPPARRARDRVARLVRGMGAVRDLDVFLAAVGARAETLRPVQQDALAASLAPWQLERDHLHARLAATLQTRPFAAWQLTLDALARRLDSADATAEPAARVARHPARIQRLLKHTRRLGRSIGHDTPDRKLHRLRIHCKKLRYACECLAAEEGGAAGEFARHTARLQSVLGHHQDLSVEAERLRAALKSPAARGTPALRSALKALLAQVAGEQARSHRACFKAWRRFERQPLRRALLQQLG